MNATVAQAVLSLASEGGVLQLLTQGWRGASTQMLGLDSGVRPMAVMPDVKVCHTGSVRPSQCDVIAQRKCRLAYIGTLAMLYLLS